MNVVSRTARNRLWQGGIDVVEFQNKTVIVTGASVGIGKATALAFAREGAVVGLLTDQVKPLQEGLSSVVPINMVYTVVNNILSQQ